MLKKYKFIVFGLIIIFIFSSLFSIIILNTPQKTEEPRIQAGENSIFNGYTPSELAEKLALAAEVAPLISKEEETHCGVTWYKYHYQNDSSITITLSGNSFWWSFDKSFQMSRGADDQGINISNNSSKGGELILNIWKRFLSSLNCQLKENDYNLSVKSHNTWGWKVIIRQVFNDNIPLIDTGVVAIIRKETSRINHFDIHDWSKRRIEKVMYISSERAKDIIYDEITQISINTSMLNFTGYIYFSGDVHYYFRYESDKTFNDSYFLTNMNGTEVEITIKSRTVYKLYVNVETGKFQYDSYLISKR